MKSAANTSIDELLKSRLVGLEQHLDADVLSYFGPLIDGNETAFLTPVEELAKSADKRDKLFVILTTNGGSARAVERYVNITRHHYKEVNFIVPDYAFSAGTIWCMSGDNIFMDYHSVLGPIDPQVQNREGKWVAALGYLDKVNELIEKARTGKLTQAEFVILKEFDLAELRGYEQAKELTIELLKQWLVQYKFKNWDKHETDPALKGQAVTQAQKQARAVEIADKLSDNKLWKSHGRPINLQTLEKDLKLRIEDYGKTPDLSAKVRAYYELFSDYMMKINAPIYIHTRNDA